MEIDINEKKTTLLSLPKLRSIASAKSIDPSRISPKDFQNRVWILLLSIYGTPPPQLLPSLTMKRRVETASLLNPFALPSKLTTKSFVVLRRPHAFHLLHFCPSPWQIPTWRSPSHNILNVCSIGEVWIRKSTSHLNGKHWWSGSGESISKLLDGSPTAQAANEAHSCVYPIEVEMQCSSEIRCLDHFVWKSGQVFWWTTQYMSTVTTYVVGSYVFQDTEQLQNKKKLPRKITRNGTSIFLVSLKNL